MARKKKDAAGDTPETPPRGGGGRRGLLIPAVVVALAVLAAGAMAGGFIGGGGAANAEATPTPTAATEPPDLGTLVQLESVTLNLAEGRFLKLGVAVELAADVVEEPPTAPIYDEIIELFGPLTYEQLSDSAVRDATKGQLLDALADTYGDDIVALYYTEFVMQ